MGPEGLDEPWCELRRLLGKGKKRKGGEGRQEGKKEEEEDQDASLGLHLMRLTRFSSKRRLVANSEA